MKNSTGAYSVSQSNTNTVATEFYIPVEVGKSYYFSRDGHAVATADPGTPSIYVYDAQKNFLRMVTQAAIAVQSGDAYVRLKVNKSGQTETLASYTGWQFEEGQVTDYIAPFAVSGEKIDDGSIGSAKLADGAVTELKTVFFDRTRNLFVPSGFVAYSNLNATYGSYSVKSENVNTAASDYYIPVEPSTDYTFQCVTINGIYVFMYEYRADKSFIGRVEITGAVRVATTGSETHYVRLQINKANQTEALANAKNIQFEKGSTRTDYIAPILLKEKYLSADDGDSSALNYKTISLSDANLKNMYIRDKFLTNLYTEASRSTPSTLYGELINGTKAVLNRHEAKAEVIRFAFITDCHVGGTRRANYDPTYNINAFIALANEKADFAINAGDLITNYYDATVMNSLQMAKDTEEEVHDMFSGLTVPYYIAKGNHDIGINGFSVVAAPSSYADGYFGIDPNSGTIYRITADNFTEYKASGLDFYQLTGYTYFTNQEIQEVCLDGYCPNAVFNSNDQYGWYYYFDVDNKLRVIVLNDFYNINDSGGSGGNSRSPYEAAWLQSVLLSALSSDLAVMTVSHTSGGLTANYSYIKSFVGSGGVYVGHVHGHEHSDVYVNSTGYNNIGVDASLISKSATCKVEGYSFDMFEIDLTNSILYETRTGRFNDHGNESHSGNLYRSEDRMYSFANSEQLA